MMPEAGRCGAMDREEGSWCVAAPSHSDDLSNPASLPPLGQSGLAPGRMPPAQASAGVRLRQAGRLWGRRNWAGGLAGREAGGAAGHPARGRPSSLASLESGSPQRSRPSEAGVLSPPLPLPWSHQLPERRQNGWEDLGCILDANLTGRSGHGGVFTISTATSQYFIRLLETDHPPPVLPR